MSEDFRFPLYLPIGLVIGFVIGLLIAWVVAPRPSAGAEPISLREEYKGEYRELIALAYIATGDVGRAEARLALLGDGNPARALEAQAQLALAGEDTQKAARAMSLLAAALQPNPTVEPTPEEGGPTP